MTLPPIHSCVDKAALCIEKYQPQAEDITQEIARIFTQHGLQAGIFPPDMQHLVIVSLMASLYLSHHQHEDMTLLKKPDGSTVGEKDVVAETIFRHTLAHSHAEADFYGEEFGLTAAGDAPAAIRLSNDALDGSSNYYSGNPNYATALAEHHRTPEGIYRCEKSVITLPSLKQLILAARGHGAYEVDIGFRTATIRRLAVHKAAKLPDKVVLSHRVQGNRSNEKLMRDLLNSTFTIDNQNHKFDIKRTGSTVVGMISLCDKGRHGSILVTKKYSEHDMEAGMLVTQEAGVQCRFLQIACNGEEYLCIMQAVGTPLMHALETHMRTLFPAMIDVPPVVISGG